MKKVLLLLFFIIYSLSFSKDNISLKIDTAKINYQVNEIVEITLKIENADDVTDSQLEFKGIENLRLVSKSPLNHSAFYKKEYRNGKWISENKKTYTRNYVFRVIKEGNFTLQVLLNQNKNKYASNLIDIEIGKKLDNQSKDLKNIFMENYISKNIMYMGEKAILNYDLYLYYDVYTKSNVRIAGFSENFKTSDFIFKDLSSGRYEIKEEFISGKKYGKVNVGKFIVSPVHSGKLNIKASDFKLSTDDGFWNSNQHYLPVNSINIDVLPIPQDNKPDNFSGIIGELKYEANYKNTRINYGDAVILELKLYGDVNLDNVSKILNKELNGFKIYENMKESVEEIRQGKYYAEKNFEIIIIPDKIGEVEFPGIDISYFDVGKGIYENIRLNSQKIFVDKSNLQNEENSFKKENERVKIEIINGEMDLKKNNEFFIIKIKKSIFYISLSIISILILVFLVIYFIKKNKNKNSLGETYKKLLNSKDTDLKYNYFNDLVKSKYGFSIKSKSKNEIKNYINNLEKEKKLFDIISYFEENKYFKVSNSTLDINKEIKEFLN